MACSAEWGVLLSKFVDGEAVDDERKLVESHLASCAGCKVTLELFSRNDKVLDSALAGEAFGDLVVDGVMAEVRRLETPPVVAPAVDGRTLWERLPRWWPAAAAAAALLLSVGAVLAFRAPDNSAELAGLRDAVAQLRDERHVLGDRIRELEEPNRTGYAIVVPTKSILVEGMFKDREKLETFEVQRSDDEGKSWSTVARDLKEPRYDDRTAKEGQTYDYRFVGHAKDGSVVASSIRMRLPVPGGRDPMASLRITFIGGTRDLTHATFEVERYVDGRPRREWFTVALGQPIGADEFATQLVFDRLVEREEVLYPGERAITRPNKLATLRAANGRPGDPTLDIWRGRSALVPIPR